MKYVLVLGITTSLLCARLLQQNNQSAGGKNPSESPPKTEDTQTSQASPGSTHGPIDVLNDTGGVNVHPYLDKVLPLIKANWYSLIPETAHPPISKKGKVLVKFNIQKDGQITDVLFVDKSGENDLDRSAFGAINASNPLPALPADYTCKSLVLQIHFLYNLSQSGIETPKGTLIPCVTSKISSVGPVGIVVSPASAQVVAGGRQQFSAKVPGDLNSGVNWTLSGSGCSSSTCGSISPEGLYTAPTVLPNPPSVTVTVKVATAPSEAASALVTLVQSPKTK